MSIVFTTEIDVDATRDEVWEVLTDFDTYGEWSNFTSVEGTARVGARLRMRMPGFRFTSTVATARPGHELRWVAKIIREGVFSGQHSFVLSDGDHGTTRVTNTEEFSGALTRPFKGVFARSNRTDGYTEFNRALKQRVETRPGR